MKYTLPKLSYSYDSLEPYIDKETMELHYTKHHQGYVNKLNVALEKHDELFDTPLDDLLTNLTSVPDDIRTAVRNNGSGHYAHSLFWSIMSPQPAKNPKEKLRTAIEKGFESVEKFKEEFSIKAGSLFGSGWVWLVKTSRGLEIVQTSGHDIPISQDIKPLMVLDVWEHAYYLKYKNERAKYVDNWWNVLDWDKLEF